MSGMRGTSGMRRMSRVKLAALAALCSLTGAAHVALAAGDTVSYSTWIVSRASGTVTLRYLLPIGAAQRLTGAAVPVLTVSKLGDYMLAHTDVWAGGHECPASDQGYDLGTVDPIHAGAGMYGFEIVFRCPGSMSGISLHDHALFERSPAHVDFARIEIDGRATRQLFTATRQRLEVDPSAGAMPPAGVGAYVSLGLRHILHGADRLCFLIAAVLLVARRRDLLNILLCLAAGYGLSILVSATGWIEPQTTLVEGFIGFLVALLAVAIALLGLERPRAALGWPALLLVLALIVAAMRAFEPALLLLGAALFSAGLLGTSAGAGRPKLWLLPAGILGLLDGFALPALLAPVQLRAWTQVPMLVGYDIGALLAESIVLALLGAGVFLLLRSGYLARVRPAVSDVGAALLGGLGTFWLVSAAAQSVPASRPATFNVPTSQTAATLGQQPQSPNDLLMRKYKLQGNTLVIRTNNPDE